MNSHFLDFEKPVADLEAKIAELKLVSHDSDLNIADEIERLEAKSNDLKSSIFANLTDWQVVKIARHPERPYTFDYIDLLFTDFIQLHGDRHFADDKAIVGGIATFNNQSVMIIGHQKGRGTKEKIKRNFGMPRPEGYRKALRFMQLAEKFKMPIITLIDTSGAYPGIDSEERGQSESIAFNLQAMSTLKVPIIATVIGEGGSGGALAIGVSDKLNMLQYSTYSVISPEGCASILWRTADKANEAAEAMGMTSSKLKELKIVDEIIPEPLGGAHRDYELTAQNLSKVLVEQLDYLNSLPVDELLEIRYQNLMKFYTSNA